MAIDSTIEWTDATWNPVAGCSHASTGCAWCYAARMAYRLDRMGQAKYAGTAEKRGRTFAFTGRINLDEAALVIPFRWRKPRRIFVNSMSDLFHENVPTEFITAVFAVMEQTPRHTYQVLTKRPARAADLADRLPWPANVWMGTSVENAEWGLRRVPELLRVPAAIRFVSAEPLLGPLDAVPLDGIDWLIAGGESGPGARPMDLDWARSLRDRCRAVGIPYHFKQVGGTNKKKAGRLLDGRTHDEFPATVVAA